nr:ribonuclease H-like domain-containing protein [Tanacetum cinerariifolium]
ISIASDEFPLLEDFPTASEERFLLLRKRDATAEEDCTANEDKGISTASDEFPLLEDFSTASEERFLLLRKRDVTAEEDCTANEDKGLPEFADDTITDYTRPSPSIESNPNDLQNNSPSVFENGELTGSILSKLEIKFVKAADSPTVIKTNKDETIRKPYVRYAKIKWVDQGKTWAKNIYTHKSRSPRTVFHKSDRTSTRTTRPNMNVAQPKTTSFYKPAHSYVKRPFQRNSAVITQSRVPRVPTVNRKFPTVNRKFLTGNSKVSTADLGNKGKAGNSQNNIDEKGYWDSGCSRHMTGNISYLSDYEPYDRGRLGHLNFKTMNKLVRHNLVRGLPSKCFENDHTCVACLKGKQHKASCKTKLVNSMTKPLHTLHMDLFGPTSV